MEDKDIIGLFFARKETAITETQSKYGHFCLYIASHILNNDEDAEECINDAYMKLWNTIPPNTPDSLQSYTGMITRQLAINRLCEKRTEKRGGRDVFEALDELEECVPDTKNGEMADELAIKNALNSFLKSLPQKTRIVFMRRYWYFSTLAELASDYGLSVINVNVILHRTRKKLKAYLKKEGILI